MAFTRCFLIAAAIMTLAGQHSFASVFGLQMVLGQCHNDTSMQRAMAALDTIPKDKRPNTFEISMSPYLDTACQLPAGKGRYDNLRTWVDKLVALGINVRVTVHLGELHESRYNVRMGTRAKEFWDNIIARYEDQPAVQFHLSPSLEDKYSKTAFKTALDRMMTQLDYAKVKKLRDARRFYFRRSPDPGRESGSVDTRYGAHSVFSRTGNAAEPSFTVSIHYEHHGADKKAGYAVWSNDGYLVYADEDEHHKKHGDSLLNRNEQLSLSTFQKRGQSASVALLWRPAFNLFDTDIKSGQLRYSRKGKRTDTSSGKLNTREQTVIRDIASVP